MLLQVIWFALLAQPAGAQEMLSPVSVCEVTGHLTEWEGRPLAIAGRFSMRGGVQWLGQEHCGQDGPAMLHLLRDDRLAPRLPPSAVMDQAAAERKLHEVRASTALSKFRFGSPDYDRWAIVYGVVERIQSKLQLMFRGDGVVFVYPDQ